MKPLRKFGVIVLTLKSPRERIVQEYNLFRLVRISKENASGYKRVLLLEAGASASGMVSSMLVFNVLRRWKRCFKDLFCWRRLSMSASLRLAWCCISNSELWRDADPTDAWLSRRKKPITEGISVLLRETPVDKIEL